MSENGEAFVGAMIIRNENGEICDIGNIMLEGVHATNISDENDRSIVSFFVGIGSAMYRLTTIGNTEFLKLRC